MKTFLWIAGSLFVILIGFIVGIFLAPLLASLTGLYVWIIPLVIAGLSLIAFIGLHLIYKKARRTSNRPSFYYPGLLIPIFLCSVLLTIQSEDKFKSYTYDRHGILQYNGSIYYNRLGIDLFRSYASYFYAYDTYGNIYICCYKPTLNLKKEYKIHTIEGVLIKSGEFYCDDNNIRKEIARSMDLIPE